MSRIMTTGGHYDPKIRNGALYDPNNSNRTKLVNDFDPRKNSGLSLISTYDRMKLPSVVLAGK
jgi:hypothetical protein